MESLEAAQWAFQTTDSFESAVIAAANLGDDADTTAAICGQFAGAYYGVNAIPQKWRDRIALGNKINAFAKGLLALSDKIVGAR